MSKIYDKSYIASVLPHLEQAKMTSTGLVARCPVCGDSKKNKYKKRFGIVMSEEGTFCNCFNCGYTSSLQGFLKQFFPALHSEYIKEGFIKKDRSSEVSTTRLSRAKVSLFKEKETTDKVYSNTSLLLKLSANRNAEQYVHSRKVLVDYIPEIFVTNDYRSLLSSVGYDVESNSVPSDTRIVLPLTNPEGKFGGFVGRTVTDPNKKQNDVLRYSKNTFDDESIWIPRSIDRSQPIYVFEGVFDAMLVKNSIAVLSSNLGLARKFFKNEKLIFCPDNEPENTAIVKKVRSIITTDNNSKTFIPNFLMTRKDISSWVVDDGADVSELQDYINSRSFSYPRSLLEFNLWLSQ
jgi:hypothetical protein